MTDGDMAAEMTQGFLTKNLGYQPHPGVNIEFLTIGGGDTGAFLAAVLKSK